MKKILLIQLPTPQLFSDTDYFPLGLLYLHSYLVSHGAAVSFLDLSGRTDDVENWAIPEADIYGITCTVVHDSLLRRLSFVLKERYPEALVIAGGAHAITLPSHLLRTTAVDAVCTGEGERMLLSLAQGNSLPFIEGLVWKDRSGNPRCNASVPVIGDIDTLPLPSYRILDTNRYGCVISYGNMALRGGTVITSRGCPFHCSFCASPAITRRKFRLNSVAYIMEMVDMLSGDLGYEGILFVDDILTINEDRLSLLCKEMKKRSLPWSALGRVDCMNEKVLTMMKDSGCVQLTVGIESASVGMLNKMRKGITPKQQADAMLLAHKVGLPVKACFIVGFPGETDATIAETEEFIRKYVVALGFYGTLNTFVPLPGSDVFKNPSAYGISIDAEKAFDSYFIAGAAGIGGYFHRENEGDVRKWVDLLRGALQGQLTYYRMQYRTQLPGASPVPQGDRR